MRFASSLRRPAQTLVTAFVFLLCTGGANADTYSGGVLNIPTLTIGNATYTNVVVNVGSILSGPLSAAPLGTGDNYDPFTGQLTIPSVTLGGSSFSNVVATVASLVSVASVAGADSYNLGTSELTIPYVQYGTAIYHNVVIKVASIVGLANGMPNATWDSYNSANNQLSVPAVEVAGHVYTNATVTVGSIVSLGGGSGTAQTIQFSIKAPGAGGLYIPFGEAGALQGSASSGLPVVYAVQTPSICALAQSTSQEQYFFLNYTTTGGTNGSAIVGGTAVASGVYVINTVNGTTANGKPLGLMPTITPYTGQYYLPPYPNFQVSNGVYWFFDDVLFANGSPTVDEDGLGLTAPGDADINLSYISGSGYIYGDSALFAAAPPNTSFYVPANVTYASLNGVVATAPLPGGGVCYVTAFQPGNGTYAPAAPVTVGVDVTAIELP